MCFFGALLVTHEFHGVGVGLGFSLGVQVLVIYCFVFSRYSCIVRNSYEQRLISVMSFFLLQPLMQLQHYTPQPYWKSRRPNI